MQDAQQGQTRGRVVRRGVLAGMAAVVAGALTRAGERVAQAAGNGAALTMGNNDSGTNNPTNETRLVRSTGGSGSYGFSISDRLGAGNLSSGALRADAGLATGVATPGVSGTLARWSGTGADDNTGVYGLTWDGAGAGVYGACTSPTLTPGLRAGVAGYAQTPDGGIGVRGEGRGYGVLGTANLTGFNAGTGIGVLGQTNSGVGVQGASNSNVGVLGQSNASVGVYASSASQYGLYATSSTSFAAIGTSNTGTGVYGSSNGNVGVQGSSNSSIGGYFSSGTSTGLYATGPAAGFAARFDGPVQVNGAFTVLGGPKSAAVPHPDGSHRRLYCVESPESWFEDFGQDQIVNGRGRVRLDPDFDALVRGDNYQVFLTPEGDCKGLYVSAKNPHTFEVRELQGGNSSLAFSYRVVAKRKDITGPRLERVEMPGTPQRPVTPPPPPAIPAVPPFPDPNTPPRLMR